MSVVHAAEAFGSELRLRLIRHYLEHPGSQAKAAAALGLNTATVSRNTEVLIRLKLVSESLDPDNRGSRLYRVRRPRYFELVQALHNYAADVPETPGTTPEGDQS